MHGAEGFKTFKGEERADYIRGLVTRMKRALGVARTKELFASCGMMCCGATSRKLARKAMQESKSLKELIQKVNKRHLGGGRLKVKDANTIVGGYDRCYCGMVSKTRVPFPDLTYCHCSTGWYKQLFETAIRRPAEVRILKSIISGSKTCEFVIRVGRKGMPNQ